MTVVDIQSELATRNPKGAKKEVAKALAEIDEGIAMLHLAADSAALGENEERLITGLYIIHRRLRDGCERALKNL